MTVVYPLVVNTLVSHNTEADICPSRSREGCSFSASWSRVPARGAITVRWASSAGMAIGLGVLCPKMHPQALVTYDTEVRRTSLAFLGPNPDTAMMYCHV